jgi:hypothetical protein
MLLSSVFRDVQGVSEAAKYASILAVLGVVRAVTDISVTA